MEDGIIYTFGDVDALVVIFDGLRLLFDPATTTFFSGTGGLGLGVATTLAAMIALIGTMNQYVTQQRLQMQGPLMGLFIYALVAIPTVDRMFISDVNTGKTLPVYDVPIGLGVIGYGMSLISFRTSELMETAFQTVAIEGTAFESTMTGGSGFLSPVKMLYALRSSALPELEDHLIYNMFSYTKFCLNRAASEDLANGLPDVNFSPDLMKVTNDPFGYMMTLSFISPNHLNAFAEFMDPTTKEESLQTCSDIRDVLNGDDSQVGSLENYLTASSRFGASRLRTMVENSATATQACADGGTCLNPATAITTSYEMAAQLLGGVDTARDFFALRVMNDFNTIAASANEFDSESYLMAASNINEAILTTQLQETLEADTFINFMLPAMNFIIMLFYALFPLAMLIMITKGMGAAQYLGGYLLIGIWGYSIIPVATAINYITIANTREALSSLITMNGFTSFGYEMMVTNAANYLSVGSNMLAAAPIVTLAVISGSVYALTSVASSAAAPSGGAMGAATRSSAQAHGQITNLGLSPRYSDVKGNPGLAPVELRSVDAASAFKVGTAHNNTTTQRGIQADVQTAKASLDQTRSTLDSKTTDIMRRVGSGTASSSELTLAESYAASGRAILARSSLDLSGYSDSNKLAIEASTGYVNSTGGGIGGNLSLGSDKLAQIGKIAGVDTSGVKQQGPDGVLNPAQTDPSALPGTPENPAASAQNGNPVGSGVGANIGANVRSDVAVVNTVRDSDTTSNEIDAGGRTSYETGHSGDVSTSTGIGSGNTSGISLSSEQQQAITAHEADLRQTSASYESARERQRTYSDTAEKANQFSQKHDYDLNDVNAHYKFRSPQAVYDHFENEIDTLLSGGGLTSAQTDFVKKQFFEDAKEQRNMRVPGGSDALSALVGGANAADVTAFNIGKLAQNPKDPSNTAQLTPEQARFVQNALSKLDSNLFRDVVGPQASEDFNKLNNTLASREVAPEVGNKLEADVAQHTSGIDFNSMGPGAAPSNLKGVSDLRDSFYDSGNSLQRALAVEMDRNFNPEAIQKTIDLNADSLGVQQGTPFKDLNSQQQNQVLAEQMNRTMASIENTETVDMTKYSSVLGEVKNGGIGQTDNQSNVGAILGGMSVLRGLGSDFNNTVGRVEGDLDNQQGRFVEADRENRTNVTGKSGFGASSELIANMGELVPGGRRDDPSWRPESNMFNGAELPSLETRQDQWNSNLRQELSREVAAGSLTQPKADLIYENHSIDRGSDVTPTSAYFGLVSGNVAGNYNVPDGGSTEKLVDGIVDFFSGTDEKAVGSTANRLTTAHEGAHAPIDAVHAQRENMKFSPEQNLQYLKTVRDGVEANGGDVSRFTDDVLSQRANERSLENQGGSNFNSGITGRSEAVMSDTVNDMLNTLPSKVDGRVVGSIVQSPLINMSEHETPVSKSTPFGDTASRVTLPMPDPNQSKANDFVSGMRFQNSPELDAFFGANKPNKSN